ncbi:MAG: ASKHA domain-containing protein [Chloroflexota bacterium]|nr:ASKHA domain-containing protein [Chloroflexota bacterium]
MYQISFQPVGRRGQCPVDKSLLDCARETGVGISSICGGAGTCYACKIQVLEGKVSVPTSHELEAFSPQELANGWRLACQTYPASDLKLHVPPESMTTTQRLQVEGVEVGVPLDPPVHAYRVEMTPPSLSDLQADADRLLEALHQQHRLRCRKVDIDVLRDLSPRLRSWDWQALVSVRDDEVVAVGPVTSRQLGLAVDLGTTKIAAYLIDLSNGRTLAAKGMMNPQISYGEDIITRISRAMGPPPEGKLRTVVVDALNQLAGELCAEVSASKEEIVEAVVVGNTVMHHLLLGLPVAQLASSPFAPAIRQALDIKSRDAGLHIAPGAYLHLLPNIAGFVGADHVAMLLATGVAQAKGVTIAMDIGTNTEVSIIDDGVITSASCASGPAFEGGHIKHGMRAASGAIERVRVTKSGIQYQTIDGVSPVGICGSGVLDILAQLYLAGVLDEGGRMLANHPRVRSNQEQQCEFVLVSEREREGRPAIVFTQHDVRELQLAKAAMRAGIQVLLEAKGRIEEEIEEVIIAGAFGSYIDVSSAVTVGMLPSLPLERFRQVGNAAGMGAKLALISASKRTEAKALASWVNYVELATAPDFMQTFIQASYLGHYRLANGKRKEID